MSEAVLADELDLLAENVRRFLEQRSDEFAVRRLMNTPEGFDRQVWLQMAEQLGLQGLIIPEEYGGTGYSYVELSRVMEEMGRALLCAPFLATVGLAATALLLSDDADAKDRYLPGIAAGTTIATLGLSDLPDRWDEAGVTATARMLGGVWALDGTARFVLDGHSADLILVAARTDTGVSLFAMQGSAPGLTRTLVATIDQTRRWADLHMQATPAMPVGAIGKGWSVVEGTLARAAAALAAEQVGGMQRVLEMAVEYSKIRIQFGKPIGTFQAIKHRCADMLLEVESSRSAAYFASAAAAGYREDLLEVASLAQAYCSDAYSHIAAENIQIHGGIGFTWEHPAHLYYKRAKSSEVFLGNGTYHRELLARHIGL